MPHTNHFATLFEYRPSWHRWLYLGLAACYYAVAVQYFEFAYSQSSIGVPYIVLVLVPPLVLLVHFVFCRLFTWGVVVSVFLAIYCSRAISEIDRALEYVRILKWEPYQAIILAIFVLVFLCGALLLLYMLRPQSTSSASAA